MKDIYEVLRQKEFELSRLREEIEALRVAAPLLSESKETGNAHVNATPELVKGWP